MLRLPNIQLPKAAATQLKDWQTLIDAETGFPAQVAAAKKQFSSKNKKTNATFKIVREKLVKMHGDLIRCAYCEDSVADEVEHLYPKSIFPERVFKWSNYTYACGPCNGPKNSKFRLFRSIDGQEIDITPPRRKPPGWVATKPPKGVPLLIDPRRENPLDFLWLDLIGAEKMIIPKIGLSPKDLRRAKYTRKILGLNRDFLLKARRNAVTSTKALIADYERKKNKKAPSKEIREIKVAIQTMQHRTVWKEFIRQKDLHPTLQAFFANNPETLKW